MDATYAQQYRELYANHWWWRARESVILQTLSRLRPDGRRGRILDVGCGDGLFFDQLSRFGEVDGVEIDASTVSAEGKHSGSIHVGGFDESFVPEKSYSLILMLDVLEHLAEPAEALRHALDLLEPDGDLIITVPAFQQIWTSHDVLNHHYRRYTKRSFGALARTAGLEVREQSYFFHWLFPLKLAVRLLERVRPPKPAAPNIPPAWLNRVLCRLSSAEERLLPKKWMPFGSSLLIVAGKPREVSPGVRRRPGSTDDFNLCGEVNP
jgi:SAM-dependent methyltransferase